MSPEISDEFVMFLMVIGALALWKTIEIAIWIFTNIDVSISLK